MNKGIAWMRGGVALAALLTGLAAAQAGSLKIESWRNDDSDIWNNTIIPAFNKHYPDIKIEFSATQPADYNAALNAKLDGGTAGDLITCRPFDRSLQLYHQASAQNGLQRRSRASSNFPDASPRPAGRPMTARRRFVFPWRPSSMASSTTRTLFKKIEQQGKPPKTMAEFHEILDKLKADGTYTPIDMGTADQVGGRDDQGFQRLSAPTIGKARWDGLL